MHTINPGLLLLHPMSQTDVLIVDVFLCLPTFQLLCLLILPNYKTQRFFSPEVLSNRLNTFLLSSSHSIHPITHMLCVCVCFCVRVIYASHSISHCYLWKQCIWFDCYSKQTLTQAKQFANFRSWWQLHSLLYNVAELVPIIFIVTKYHVFNL